MHRRHFLISGMSLASALAVGACGTDEDEPVTGPPGTDGGPTDAGGADDEEAAPRVEVLRLSGSDSGFPSPFAYMRGPGFIRASLIYDTLVWKDATGEILPWLAESFEESADGLTHTFTLRPDILWHDGEPLTAQDVAFTFQYFGEQTISPQVIMQPLPGIEEVVAVDDLTVEFRLATPLAAFYGLGGAGSILIVPEHIWSAVPEAATATDPAVLVGSGPYRLESYAQGEGSYVYTANDDYFLGAPFVSRLEFSDVDDALAGVSVGELDFASASGVLPAVLESFEANPELTVLEGPPGNSGSGLFWNIARGGALADVVFRQACARAIDRDDLVERLHGGNAQPGNPGWIPPGNPFHVDVEQYAFDPEAAEAMLDGAGYVREGDGVRQGPDGAPLAFTLSVTSPVTPVVELVVGALGAIGVQLTPQALDPPSFNQLVIGGESEMSIIGFGGMNTDHAASYLFQVYSSTTRTTQHAQGYVNPEVDELTALQDTQTDVDERMETVAEIQELIADDLPLLPLVYPDSFGVFNPSTFDQWYFTVGGVGGTVPTIENKQVFITGRQTGIEIRPNE
ncbi:MAG: ABC transporter substrate-binding protein [Acidimicrobiales bacterium]